MDLRAPERAASRGLSPTPSSSRLTTRKLERRRSNSSEEAASRDTDRISPTMMSDAKMDEPPDEMNGRGLPVVGNTPIAHAMFKNAWKTRAIVSPPAIIMEKSSRADRAISVPV